MPLYLSVTITKIHSDNHNYNVSGTPAGDSRLWLFLSKNYRNPNI